MVWSLRYWVWCLVCMWLRSRIEECVLMTALGSPYSLDWEYTIWTYDSLLLFLLIKLFWLFRTPVANEVTNSMIVKLKRRKRTVTKHLALHPQYRCYHWYVSLLFDALMFARFTLALGMSTEGAFIWTNEKLDFLVDLYEAKPCLYDRSLKSYSDRDLRFRAEQEIAERLSASGKQTYRPFNLKCQRDLTY